MKKLLITTLTFVLFQTIHAQQPWRAKLFVHFDTNGVLPPTTDTLWFGCDSLGGEGFQQGLDELDTTYAENKVYFIDETTQSQLGLPSPYNLSKSIKAFNKNGKLTFKIKALGYVYAISWDTTEFIYEQPDFHLYTSSFKCYNCYLDFWESEQYTLMGRNTLGEPKFYNKDSIDVKQGGYMDLDLILNFKDTSKVGLGDYSNNTNFNIIGNPAKDNFTIQFAESFTGSATLYDNIGKIAQAHTELINLKSQSINVCHITSGIYYLQLIDKYNKNYKQIKILKL